MLLAGSNKPTTRPLRFAVVLLAAAYFVVLPPLIPSVVPVIFQGAAQRALAAENPEGNDKPARQEDASRAPKKVMADVYIDYTNQIIWVFKNPWEPLPPEPEGPLPRHFEIFTGADVARTVWLTYGGTTLAPFSDIHEPGLRLRFSGGYGEYVYTSRTANPPFKDQEYRASTIYFDALVGYLFRLDPMTIKVFAGVNTIDHQIRPRDNINIVQGPDIGAKGVVELWLNMGSDAWGSLDLSWSQAHNTRSARARLGYRVLPHVSLGLEAAINVDAQAAYKMTRELVTHRSTAFDYARVGAFARADWHGGEISASAGLLGDFTEQRSPYVTINWIKQF